MRTEIFENAANSLFTALAPYGISATCPIKSVNAKPISFFSEERGGYGVFSDYSSDQSSFNLETTPPIDQAYHTFSVAAARLLSAGIKSRYAYYALGVSSSDNDSFIIKAQEGIKIASSRISVPVIAGELYDAQTPTISVLLYGNTLKKKHLTKNPVKPGYTIWLTGNPCDTYIDNLFTRKKESLFTHEKNLINRYMTPPLYNPSIDMIMTELTPLFISTCSTSIIDTLLSACDSKQPKGFSLNFNSFPLSDDLIEFCHNDRLEAFKKALTALNNNELLIITKDMPHTSQYIDDVYLSLVGKITNQGYFIETHNTQTPFNPHDINSCKI